jgi:ABC-2 family transporter protein
MIWLTWRQFRVQAIVAALAFVALGVVLGYTGPHLVHLYHSSGITTCQATPNGDCGPLIDDFTSHYPLLHSLGALIILIPGVIGVFWGAPLLARELETGTHRVAWTQTVTRTRWLTTKVVLLGVASVVTTAAFSVIIALWSSPIDKVSGNRFSPGTFSQRGIVPLAYAAFAFALGVAAGAVIRRTLPAMAATLGGFAATRFVIQQWIRPHFATEQHLTGPLFGADSAVKPGTWIVSSRAVDRAGHTVAFRRDTLRSLCQLPQGEFQRSALQTCAQRLGIHSILTVQPANRYWPFQTWETAIFAALAAALIAFGFWWTRNRII